MDYYFLFGSKYGIYMVPFMSFYYVDISCIVSLYSYILFYICMNLKYLAFEVLVLT